MNTYQLYYIVSNEMKEEKSNEIIEMFKSKMNEVINVSDEGIKKLAYKVKGNDYGRYILIEFKDTKYKSSYIEYLAKNNEDILKAIVVRVSDFWEN